MLMAGGPQAGQHGDDVPSHVTSPGGLGPSRGPAGAPNACLMMSTVMVVVKRTDSGSILVGMPTTPRNVSSSLTTSELASRPEVGEFCQWLIAFVDTGDGRDELTIAAEAVVRLAREQRLDAVTVVGAVELIGCPPLRVHD